MSGEISKGVGITFKLSVVVLLLAHLGVGIPVNFGGGEKPGSTLSPAQRSPNITFDCSPVMLYEDGRITSPGWPDGYPRNTSCWYYIGQLGEFPIRIKFDHIDIHHMDYISIKDGPFQNSTELASVPINKPFDPENYIVYRSTTNYMTIHFVSGPYKGGSGWSAFVGFN
ncbi:hypothetical protein PMAYCL1PPCAC_26229 [Pristionchus mayeri]|uniref:CUB domain-containing protein n=1 Tax=Pristionchus mayeri TaxID=1317129 RepID=A0AAN5D5J8_9BILA|nr:hypothetical protein PMAYCL1PPCAC_26229 [Pristionchus mayeri]